MTAVTMTAGTIGDAATIAALAVLYGVVAAFMNRAYLRWWIVRHCTKQGRIVGKRLAEATV